MSVSPARPETMKVLLFLGAVLFLSAINSSAAPCDDEVPPSPKDGSEPCDTPAPDQVHYRKETLDTVSKNTSQDTSKISTKSKEKVKVKHLKNGYTETIIDDTNKTKKKNRSVSEEYNQTNHTLNEDGLEDSSCLTEDHKHMSKETDTIKKKDREVIIRDAQGNIVSDMKQEKVKEKVKKKEKDRSKSKSVHTVKHVEPPPEACDDAPAPAPDC